MGENNLYMSVGERNLKDVDAILKDGGGGP
jgi:hypothetical protein